MLYPGKMLRVTKMLFCSFLLDKNLLIVVKLYQIWKSCEEDGLGNFVCREPVVGANRKRSLKHITSAPEAGKKPDVLQE